MAKRKKEKNILLMILIIAIIITILTAIFMLVYYNKNEWEFYKVRCYNETGYNGQIHIETMDYSLINNQEFIMGGMEICGNYIETMTPITNPLVSLNEAGFMCFETGFDIKRIGIDELMLNVSFNKTDCANVVKIINGKKYINANYTKTTCFDLNKILNNTWREKCKQEYYNESDFIEYIQTKNKWQINERFSIKEYLENFCERVSVSCNTFIEWSKGDILDVELTNCDDIPKKMFKCEDWIVSEKEDKNGKRGQEEEQGEIPSSFLQEND